jgi:hypothetical protein
VRDQCREFGVEFDEWQDGLGRAILAKRSNGIYASTVGGVVLSIPRQVAKTFLVSRIIFALCVLFPGLEVLWTAHHNRTITNTFRSLQGFARRPQEVLPHIAKFTTASARRTASRRSASSTARSSCSAPASRASAVASTRSTSRCSTRRRS